MTPGENHFERYISLLLAIGFAIYDAYAQAHCIPWSAPSWLIGIILAPWGEAAYGKVKKLPATVKSIVTKK